MTEQTVPTTAPADIDAALARGGLVDITTHGRRSGRPHRIEIAFFNLDGRIYISGLPGPRDWYANLLADPSMTLHVKGRAVADLPARAVLITDEPTRRPILEAITRAWRRQAELERFVADSPLIEVILDEPRTSAGG